MGARHRNTSERRLTRSQIVDAAAKIVGEDRARHADVEAIVDYMSKLCERSNLTRSREIQDSKTVCKAIPCGTAQGDYHDEEIVD